MKCVLIILTTWFGVFAAIASAGTPSPQELARPVITDFQGGRADQLRTNLEAYTPTLEKGARDFPKDPLIHFALATCYTSQEKKEACVEEMSIAYTNSNKDSGIGTMYAFALIMPKMAMDLTVLGEAYLKNGDLDKAGKALDEALAINPKIPSALYYKAVYCEKTGNAALAAKDFQDAYTYEKQRLEDNGEDYYLMFLICQKLDRNDEAETYKAEAAKLLFTFDAPWRQK